MSSISPNFAICLSFFPNFGQGAFPKIAGKSPVSVFVPCHQPSGVELTHLDIVEKCQMISIKVPTSAK